jgi:benzoyl-CoA reductase subunit C
VSGPGPGGPGPAPGDGGPGLRALVERAETLCFDFTLPAARAWKERTRGLVIGFLPIDAPREILHAQGVLPVGIVGGGAIEIIRGDAYYQSYICHLPRSTIELALNGSLDVLDGMLFPSICDVIRNLSGMWTMLFPGAFVRYLDAPQDFDPALGGAFHRQALEELARDLARRGARALDPEALRRSIAVYNDNRRRVRDLYALRRVEPWRMPTSELYIVVRAGLALPVEDHTAMLRDYRRLLAEATDRRPLDQARVVLTGCFCEQPPLGLIRTLERSGCYIVDDDLIQVHRYLRDDVPLEGDPLDNLVRAFLTGAIASPTRYIGDDAKGRDLLERVRAAGAEGVVFCAPSFCDPALLDQPMTARAVEKAGVPWTAFKYSENSGQFQVIREQAGTFADSIKLWSGA